MKRELRKKAREGFWWCPKCDDYAHWYDGSTESLDKSNPGEIDRYRCRCGTTIEYCVRGQRVFVG